MKAIWLENNQLRYRNDVTLPEPRAKEALVKVSRAGICGTDLELIKGYYPFCGIPGHEFVGTIVQAPDRPERVRQRVVGEINISCAVCATCLAGRKSHCPRRTVMGIVDHHGAFAEYVCLPLANLIPVPDSVSDDAAVFVEPLAAALKIREQIPIGAKDNVQIDLASIVIDEITLVGSRCGPYTPALALLESGQVDPAAIIDARFPLDDALNAFDRAAQPGTLKVIVEMA